MEADFWHQRWAERRIHFHQKSVTPMLAEHWDALGIAKNTSVFVPLCGKSQDMIWLNDRGHTVQGVELSRTAIKEFDAENNLHGRWVQVDGFDLYQTESIKIWCADFLALSSAQLGPLHAVFDRAALIALPPDMRRNYSRHIDHLAASGCQQLLICLEYEQSKRDGPPFAVFQEELQTLYPTWQLSTLATELATNKQPESRDSVYRLQQLRQYERS